MNRRKQNRLLVTVGILVLLLLGAMFLARQPLNAPSRSQAQSPAASEQSTQGRAPATQTRQANQGTDPVSGLRWVSANELPPEAATTLKAIQAGPPYPYQRDGVVFGNFEGVLPKQPRGYYHEFTVKTPGESDRGARRIVAGGPDNGQANAEFYYTADHYQSFRRIRP